MTTTKSLIKLGALGLLAFAIVGTPVASHAEDATTNTVKTVKHKKKKTADTNAPAIIAPVTTPVAAVPVKTVESAKTPAPTTTLQAGHNKSGVLPFHGKLKAVDNVAKTISVGTRTFQITSETMIEKGGKPATLEDGVVGDETGGAYKKTEDGKLVITKLRFGPKIAPENGAAK